MTLWTIRRIRLEPEKIMNFKASLSARLIRKAADVSQSQKKVSDSNLVSLSSAHSKGSWRPRRAL
jgi:hypothetical protein